jgi:hypothetical protein
LAVPPPLNQSDRCQGWIGSLLPAGQAIAHSKTFLPVPPWITWDYAANVQNKTRFFDMLAVKRTDQQGGREGIGTAYHCQHRTGDIYYL